MSVDDFTLMLTYLMEVCWAAAAGDLGLVMSDRHSLTKGVCLKNSTVSPKVQLQ